TVIVPGLGRSPRHEGHQLLLWAEHPDPNHQARGGGNQLLLAPIAEAGGHPDAIYRYIQGLHEEQSDFENGRLLYVAATRAKHQLHLLGQVVLDEEDRPKMPPKHSLLASLWPAVKGEFGAAARAYKEACPREEENKNSGCLSAGGFFSRL